MIRKRSEILENIFVVRDFMYCLFKYTLIQNNGIQKKLLPFESKVRLIEKQFKLKQNLTTRHFTHIN